MALGTVSVCLTVLVLNLHHRDAERPVPRWARILILKYLARMLCVHARKPKTMAGNLYFDAHSSLQNAVNIKTGLRRIARDTCMLRPMLNANGDICVDSGYPSGEQIYPSLKDECDKSHEWKELAHVLDRLFFWIVFVFMTASALIILLVPYYKEKI